MCVCVNAHLLNYPPPPLPGDTIIPYKSVHDLLDVRLVDFAHAYSRDSSEDGPDENFLYGLKSFISSLDQLK